jgi:hypothetical protein
MSSHRESRFELTAAVEHLTQRHDKSSQPAKTEKERVMNEQQKEAE